MRHTSLHQVRWGDMDAYQHVNNVAYAAYIQEARVAMLAAAGVRASDRAKAGTFVAARLRVEYLRQLRYRPAPIAVSTWVSSMSVSKIVLASQINDVGTDPGLPYCRALTVLVPFDLGAGHVRRLSAEERDLLAVFLEPDEV
ncbi:MAG: acyl-CoA thioesterase [Sporichthyaceae bacterium]